MYHLSMKMKKGQIFTWDLIFGIIIFMGTLTITIQVWEAAYSEVRHSEEKYEISWLSETVSDQLVRTAGDPYEWTPDNVVALGLAESRGSSRSVESRILDADKVLSLIQAFKKNYTNTRNKMLGSSRYNVYLELSCMNNSDTTCLQGLPLDYIDESVECLNQEIHVNRYKGITDSYIFLEAEDLWDEANSVFCYKGCSGNNMSQIWIEPAQDVTIKLRPGKYMIWVRVLERSSGAQFLVDGEEHQLYGLGIPGLIVWNWMGEYDLGGETTLGFTGAVPGDFVDAVLITSDSFYNPGSENPETYGDPNVYEPCIIGNLDEGSEGISTTKTAVIGIDPTMEDIFRGVNPVVDNIIEVKVVVWGGIALPARYIGGSTSTITTTTLSYDLECQGSPGESCISANLPVIEIENITLWGVGGEDHQITCGNQKDFTIDWRGRHAGDANYFAFFVLNESHFIGSCWSNNSENEVQGENYDYNMNCSFTPLAADLKVPDGAHNLIVTAEDYLGYCYPYPTNDSMDDQDSVLVDFFSCVEYQDIECNPPGFGVRYECLPEDTVESIHRVKVEDDKLVCGQSKEVNVYWAGNHGDSNGMQWTFMVRSGGLPYTNVSNCNSTANDLGTTTFYNSTCTIDVAGLGIPNDNYEFYAIAETSSLRWCDNPDSLNADAVKDTIITVEGC